MSLRYSPSTGGFYDTAVHRQIPGDVVSVAAARHRELLAAQAEGASIVPSGKTGKPIIVPPPAADDGMVRDRLKRAVRRECEGRIAAVMPLARQVAILRERVLNNAEIGQQALDGFRQIEAIEQAALAIEAAIDACPVAGLRNYPVRGNALWPEPDQF